MPTIVGMDVKTELPTEDMNTNKKNDKKNMIAFWIILVSIIIAAGVVVKYLVLKDKFDHNNGDNGNQQKETQIKTSCSSNIATNIATNIASNSKSS